MARASTPASSSASATAAAASGTDARNVGTILGRHVPGFVEIIRDLAGNLYGETRGIEPGDAAELR